MQPVGASKVVDLPVSVHSQEEKPQASQAPVSEQLAQETKERVSHEERLARAKIESEIKAQEAAVEPRVSDQDLEKINECHKKVMQENLQKMQSTFMRLSNPGIVISELAAEVKKFDDQATHEEKMVLLHLVKAQCQLMQQPAFLPLFSMLQSFLQFADLEGLAKSFLVSFVPQYTKDVKAISQFYIDDLVTVYGNDESQKAIVALAKVAAYFESVKNKPGLSDEQKKEFLEILAAEDTLAKLKETTLPKELKEALVELLSLPPSQATKSALEDLKRFIS